MVAATLGMLAAAFAIQLLVYDHGGHTSLSDLPHVFLHRGIGLHALPYADRVLEYPVGAGWLLYLAAVIAPSPMGVLVATAIGATVLCVVITIVLERRCGPRAWRWAVGTPVLLFAFQNWDIFAIAAMLFGLLAFERRRDGMAGALLALGIAIKLFPVVLLPPLVALRLAQGDRRGAGRLIAGSAAVMIALNGPLALVNFRGWWWPVAFQGRRDATWGSIWPYVYRLLGVANHGAPAAHMANVVSLLALTIGIGWLTVRAAQRRLEAASLAGAAVAIFLVCNKVYSPTYDVWLVVFFALLPVSRRLWLVFCAVDLAVYLTVFGYFHQVDSLHFVRDVLPALVVVRTATLVWFIARVAGPGAQRATAGAHVHLDAPGLALPQ